MEAIRYLRNDGKPPPSKIARFVFRPPPDSEVTEEERPRHYQTPGRVPNVVPLNQVWVSKTIYLEEALYLSLR